MQQEDQIPNFGGDEKQQKFDSFSENQSIQLPPKVPPIISQSQFAFGQQSGIRDSFQHSNDPFIQSHNGSQSGNTMNRQGINSSSLPLQSQQQPSSQIGIGSLGGRNLGLGQNQRISEFQVNNPLDQTAISGFQAEQNNLQNIFDRRELFQNQNNIQAQDNGYNQQYQGSQFSANLSQINNNPQYNIGNLGVPEQQAKEMINVFKKPTNQQKENSKKLKPFVGRVYKVMKLAESSIGYNPRMMGIRPNGMLVYYSQVIDNVKTGKIDTINLLPKAGVYMDNIRQIQMNLQNTGKMELIVTFLKNHMYTFKKGPNGSIEYPKANKEISWTFLMDAPTKEEESEDIKKQRVEWQDAEQRKKEEADGQAMMDRKLKEQDERIKSMQEMQKEKQEKEKKQKEEEEQKLAEREKEDMLLREQRAKEEEMKKKREDQERKHNQKKSKLESAWEYRLYMIMDELTQHEDFDSNLRSGLKLFQLVGQFREKCVQSVKELVDDLSLPENNKHHTQVDTLDVRYNLRESEEMIFFINQILIRVSNTEFNQMQYDSRKQQLINHEFRSYEILSDILLLSRRSTSCPLKVPLSCSVEYRGFKCLCMADIPITEGCMVVGAMSNGAYITHTPLNNDLNQISQILNIKPYKLPIIKGIKEIYLSIFAEVYRAKPEMWDEIRKLINENSEIWEELHSVLKKQKERLDKLEDGKNSKFYDPDLDKQIQERFKDQFYIVKLGGIFPVQIDLAKQTYNYYSNRLRPELVTEHCPEPLSPGAFLSPVNSAEQDQDDIKVAQAGQMLINEIIPTMVQSLDKLTVVPVDSPTLTKIFHQHGVNMRFLGSLAKLSQLPHLKEIAMIEMIGRTLKRILNHHWVHYTNVEFREQNQDLFRGNTYQISSNTFLQQAVQKEMPADFTARIQKTSGEIAIDFLNLIFGNQKDTKTFWNDIVRTQVQNKYQFDIGPFPVEVTPGGLMHSVLYHCRININYKNTIKFFNEKSPFQLSQFVCMAPLSKTYTYKSSEIRVLADKFKDYRANMKTLDLALKSLNLKISIEKALKNLNNQPHSPLPEAILFSDMGEIHLQLAELQSGSAKELELDQAIAKARIAMDMIPPFHAESVKPLCVLLKAYYKKPQHQDMALEYFDQAINILEFHVGPYHPLHASLYCIMSQCYLLKKRYQDSLILLKSALICCTRILGNNHSMTAEVYKDMAHVYMKMSDIPETIKVLEKALVINEAEKGQNSPDCAKLMLNISGLYAQIGRFDRTLHYSKIALSIFEANDVSFNQELLESTYMCARSAASLGDPKSLLEFSEKMFFLIEKYSLKKYDYYEYAIKQVMTTTLDEQTSELKNVLYKLMTALSSNPNNLSLEDLDLNVSINIRQSIMNVQEEKSNIHSKPPMLKVVQPEQRFKPPLEDKMVKEAKLNQIIHQIRPAKTIQNLFKAMFYCIDGRTHEILHEKRLYNELDKFLERIKDPAFNNYLELYEMLIDIYGESYFYNLLKQSFKFTNKI